jgi:hypothetical protein
MPAIVTTQTLQRKYAGCAVPACAPVSQPNPTRWPQTRHGARSTRRQLTHAATARQPASRLIDRTCLMNSSSCFPSDGGTHTKIRQVDNCLQGSLQVVIDATQTRPALRGKCATSPGYINPKTIKSTFQRFVNENSNNEAILSARLTPINSRYQCLVIISPNAHHKYLLNRSNWSLCQYACFAR